MYSMQHSNPLRILFNMLHTASQDHNTTCFWRCGFCFHLDVYHNLDIRYATANLSKGAAKKLKLFLDQNNPVSNVIFGISAEINLVGKRYAFLPTFTMIFKIDVLVMCCI